MNILKTAIVAVLFTMPAFSQGQEEQTDAQGTDEIVVLGRVASTSSVRVEVDQKLLVDSATVQKTFPARTSMPMD